MVMLRLLVLLLLSVSMGPVCGRGRNYGVYLAEFLWVLVPGDEPAGFELHKDPCCMLGDCVFTVEESSLSTIAEHMKWIARHQSRPPKHTCGFLSACQSKRIDDDRLVLFCTGYSMLMHEKDGEVFKGLLSLTDDGLTRGFIGRIMACETTLDCVGVMVCYLNTRLGPTIGEMASVIVTIRPEVVGELARAVVAEQRKSGWLEEFARVVYACFDDDIDESAPMSSKFTDTDSEPVVVKQLCDPSTRAKEMEWLLRMLDPDPRRSVYFYIRQFIYRENKFIDLMRRAGSWLGLCLGPPCDDDSLPSFTRDEWKGVSYTKETIGEVQGFCPEKWWQFHFQNRLANIAKGRVYLDFMYLNECDNHVNAYTEVYLKLQSLCNHKLVLPKPGWMTDKEYDAVVVTLVEKHRVLPLLPENYVAKKSSDIDLDRLKGSKISLKASCIYWLVAKKIYRRWDRSLSAAGLEMSKEDVKRLGRLRRIKPGSWPATFKCLVAVTSSLSDGISAVRFGQMSRRLISILFNVKNGKNLEKVVGALGWKCEELIEYMLDNHADYDLKQFKRIVQILCSTYVEDRCSLLDRLFYRAALYEFSKPVEEQPRL